MVTGNKSRKRTRPMATHARRLYVAQRLLAWFEANGGNEYNSMVYRLEIHEFARAGFEDRWRFALDYESTRSIYDQMIDMVRHGRERQ